MEKIQKTTKETVRKTKKNKETTVTSCLISLMKHRYAQPSYLFPPLTSIFSSFYVWRIKTLNKLQELELLHSRIRSLANLRLPRFAGHLRKLCLRQNIISYLDPDDFHQLTLLEELDLYDNKIRHVGEALDKLGALKYVF